MAKFGFDTTSDEAATALAAEIHGKTVIITGVTAGSLGSETARAIVAQKPSLLILASRSEDKIAKVLDGLETYPETTVRALKLDLGSFRVVREAAEQILAWTSAVDVVVETAGVMAVSTFTKTVDGVEEQFAINHLGHFLFTNLIMPRLLASKSGARVVPFTSDSHKQAVLNLDDVNFHEGASYNKWWAYGQSKACNILFAKGLADRFGSTGLVSIAVDPGVIVTTSLTRSVPQEDFKALGWIDEQGNLNTAAFTPKSLPQGAGTGIIAAFDPSLSDHNGSVMEGGIVNKDAAAAYTLDKANADKLWHLSQKLVGQEFP